MSEHTPGPWTVQLLEEKHGGYENWKTFCIRANNNCHLASVGHIDRFHANKTEANARLMAAAPNMFQALQDIALGQMQIPSAKSFESHAIGIAKAAIKKATP